MLESNGSDYCSGDDVFISHGIVGLFRHVTETSEQTSYTTWHRNPQDRDFNNTRKIYHHYGVVRIVWQFKSRFIIEHVNGECGVLQLSG